MAAPPLPASTRPRRSVRPVTPACRPTWPSAEPAVRPRGPRPIAPRQAIEAAGLGETGGTQSLLGACLTPRPERLESVLMRLTGERLALESGFDQLRCLPFLRQVKLFDFQERAVRHVLQRLGGRALMADEVGLGKTIEALCALKELTVRGLVQRALILTPATLVTQWHGELRQKFDLDFAIAERPSDWGQHPRLVASLDTAKGERHAEKVQAQRWDLVIVDEAHRLKNRRTRNWQFVNGLRSRYLLLLSATPFQNDLLELFNLVTVLRPGQLFTDGEFRRQFIGRGDKRQCRDPAGLRELLRQVMIRNRRGEVGVEFTARRGETRRLEMPAPQRRLYDEAIAFCRRRFYDIYGRSAALVASGYLKMLCGSTHRFTTSLRENLIPRARELGQEDVLREAEALLETAEGAGSDVKLEMLVRDLSEHDDKTLLFTQYRGTLRPIVERLRREGIRVAEFHGGMDLREKDAAVEEFRGETRVLAATDAGCEGRNLQFCHRLVNYDLPWNPMKIEQRIGRVHRLGQTRDVIVVNYTLVDTIEDRLLQLLERKLNLFRLVVGEVEMILGNFKLEQEIAQRFLDSADDQDFDRQLQRLGEELGGLRSDYDRQQEANHAALDGLGGSS